MTLPPLGPEQQLWMNAEDIFYIKGRGTVVTGRLEGNGVLALGDAVVCDGEHWTIAGIQKFREVLKTAEPGMNIGILLRNGPPSEVLRGKKLLFVPNAKRSRVAARQRNGVGGKLRRRQG